MQGLKREGTTRRGHESRCGRKNKVCMRLVGGCWQGFLDRGMMGCLMAGCIPGIQKTWPVMSYHEASSEWRSLLGHTVRMIRNANAYTTIPLVYN